MEAAAEHDDLREEEVAGAGELEEAAGPMPVDRLQVGRSTTALISRERPTDLRVRCFPVIYNYLIENLFMLVVFALLVCL